MLTAFIKTPPSHQSLFLFHATVSHHRQTCLSINYRRLLIVGEECDVSLSASISADLSRNSKFGQKSGKNVRHFACLPKYVLLLPVIINRHKSAVVQRNGIGLSGQQKRYKHYANALQCYDKPTLPTLCIMRWGTEEISPCSRAPVERPTVELVTIKFPSLYGIQKSITMLTNSPPEIPFLSQMNPVHNLASYFLKISCNIICPPKLHLSSDLLLAVYPTKT